MAGLTVPLTGESSVDAHRGAGRDLRLLFVTPRYLPFSGGTEAHVREVSVRLTRVGVDVTVLTANPGGFLPSQESSDGVKVKRVRAWPAGRDYYLAPDLWSVISKGGWDIVHVQSFHTLVPPVAMLAALRSGIPYVLTFHSGGHSSGLRNALRGTQRRALGPLLRRADRLVAVAQFERELFSRELGVPMERIALIPNGSDLPRVAESQAEENTDGDKVIVSVGRLERYKGHQRVISAMPELLRRCPRLRLRILGVGPYRDELVKLSLRLGVGDRVEIGSVPPGDRGAMTAALMKAAAVVCMSEYETHPVAVMEALSVQRPVLVADTSGLKELADRGWAARIPLHSRPNQVAEAILEQLEHPLIPPVLDLPTWDDCADKLLLLYRHVVAGRTKCAS